MDYALTANGLTKTYKDFTLKDITFQVPRGAIVGLIGENGAGKSTTINAILGLIKNGGANSLCLAPPLILSRQLIFII